MKKHISIILFLFLAFLTSKAGVIHSFEDGLVPTSFTTKTGSLKIQTSKAKLGTKSLHWDWVAGDTLIASPAYMNTSSIKTNGGITVWIYNENPTNQPLNMWFLEFSNSTTRKCKLEVKLNFKGWRRVTARFRQDMGHPGYTLRSMKWAAPSAGFGSIYIDYLEFVDDVSWERMSDLQYKVNNPSDLDDFFGIYNAIPFSPPAITVSEAQRNGITTINSRLKDWHLGSGNYSGDALVISRTNSFNSYVTNARNRISQLSLTTLPDETVQGGGLFPMDFYNQTIEGEAVKTFREISERYMFQLAYDAVKNNNVASKDLVSKIFDWYYDQGWAAGSALGTLRFEMLRSSGFYHSAYIFKDLLSEAQAVRIRAALKWFTMYGKIYQTHEYKGENADEIRTLLLPKLFTVLSLDNESEKVVALQKYVQYANNALSLAGGYLDCIKPDYSGYHHRGVYYNAYFPDALYAATLVYYTLADTPFALSTRTFENLKNALLTFQFVSSGYSVQAGTTGRFPTQTQVLEKLLPAFAYLALSTPHPDAELTAAFKALWKPTEEPVKSFISRVTSDIAFKNTIGEVEKLVELAEKGTAISPFVPTGTKVLPYAGMFMSRKSNWTVSMKGYSKYIWDFESSSSENLYGRYLSYGQIQFSKLNSNINSSQPADSEWDWSHIPGTTAKYLTKQELTTTLQRNFSDDPFLGGVAFDENTAVFSNSLHDNTFDKNFYAKKSIFQFDSIFYLMGTGIKNTDSQHEVHTTLFQNKKITSTDNIVVNGNTISSNQSDLQNPVMVDNYGTAYILKDEKTTINFSNNLITVYINHGSTPENGSYGYLMIPEASQTTISALSGNFDTYLKVLKQDQNVHAVYYEPSKTFAAAIFNATNAIKLNKIERVNIPMVLVAKEKNDTLLIAFSDPDMHRPSATDIGTLTTSAIVAESQPSTVKIELIGEYEQFESSVSGITNSIENGRTIIEFSNAKDGTTYFVSLKKKVISDVDETIENSFSINKIAEFEYKVNSFLSENYKLRLIDSSGKMIINKTDLSGNNIFSTKIFPNGVYILDIISNKKKWTKKIIK